MNGITSHLLATTKKQIEFLKSHYPAMREQLVHWANINSGSCNLDGLARMHQALQDAFAKTGGLCETLTSNAIPFIDDHGSVVMQETGMILRVSKRLEAPHRILLCGHMDTVFGVSSPFQQVRELGNDKLNGPGVADMKGGLVVMLYALLAFEKTPWAQHVGWQVLINADEEIGSLGSQDVLEKAALEADVGLVYEPSMTPEGTFAGQRKGSGKFTIVVYGKQAHAGRAFHQGRNAVCHLANLVADIHALNSHRENVTINVGYMHGGGALNVVPDVAVAKLDVRILTPEDRDWFLNNLADLIGRYNVTDGYQVQLHGGFSRPPKGFSDSTERLFRTLKDVGSLLGVPVEWQTSGGCCDGNNLAAKGLPVIDTLGVVGGHIHSEQEYVVCDSLITRATMSFLLLVMLAQGHIEAFKR